MSNRNDSQDSSSIPKGSTSSPSSSVYRTRSQASAKDIPSSLISASSCAKRRLNDDDEGTSSRRQPKAPVTSEHQSPQISSSDEVGPSSSKPAVKPPPTGNAAKNDDVQGNSAEDAVKKENKRKIVHFPVDIQFIGHAQKAGDYDLRDILGNGSYGVVFKGVDSSGTEKAVKLVRDPKVARTEIATMERVKMKEPNQFLGIAEKWFKMDLDDNDITVFVMELYSNDLFNLAYNESMKFPLPSLMTIMGQLCSAVNHLALLGILHADIKPENIMMASHATKKEGHHFLCIDPKVKLIDFNSVKFFNRTKINRTCQPHLYRAPEVFLRNPADEQMEIWSIGVLTLEILDHKLIFHIRSNRRHEPLFDAAALKQILEFLGEFDIPEKMINECGKADLLKYLPNRSGKYWARIQHGGGQKSLAAYQKYAKDEHWEEFSSIIERMLKFDPEERVTPAEAVESLKDWI